MARDTPLYAAGKVVRHMDMDGQLRPIFVNGNTFHGQDGAERGGITRSISPMPGAEQTGSLRVGRQTPVTDDGNHIDPGRSSASQMGTGECCVCEGAGMVGVVATRRSVATSCKIHSRNAWTSGLRRAAAVAIR